MLRFGPAGIPISCDGGNYDGLLKVHELGLEAMEVEFVRGVHLKKEDAPKMKAFAQTNNISLSCHAPYWINLCAMDKTKITNTIRNLLESAKAAHSLGARIVVFHPGFYMGRDSTTCLKLERETTNAVVEKMRAHGIKDVLLGPELMGRTGQFGTLEEIIELAPTTEGVAPVIDFCHFHARGNGRVKKKDDYKLIFDSMEKSLGPSSLQNFHSHFSEVEYTSKGERRHLELGSGSGPNYKWLMELCAENGYSGTVICESPLLEQDALRMKKYYASL